MRARSVRNVGGAVELASAAAREATGDSIINAPLGILPAGNGPASARSPACLRRSPAHRFRDGSRQRPARRSVLNRASIGVLGMLDRVA